MKFVKVYHLSPHANIQRFKGRYSSKMGSKGLFVSESWESIVKDWSTTILSKRFGGRKPSTAQKRLRKLRNYLDTIDEKSEEYKIKDKTLIRYYRRADLGGYKSITIYTLLVPEDIFIFCENRINALANDAFEKSGAGAIGAWGWGIETFILDKFLNKIRIIGRKTYTNRQIRKLYNAFYYRQREQESNVYSKMEKYRKEVGHLTKHFGNAPLLDRARRYIDSIRNTCVRTSRSNRHYKIIRELIDPYRKQLKVEKWKDTK